MKLNKLYQGSFHGLKFSEVPNLELTNKNLPNGRFYEILYKELNARNLSISTEFISAKTKNAELVYQCLNEKKSLTENTTILSWGAGLGIVESYLYEQSKASIDAIETVKDNKFWNPNVAHFININELDPNKKYDVFLVVSALYTMTDDDLLSFIKIIRNHLKENSIVMLHEQAPLPIKITVTAEFKIRLKMLLRRTNTTLWGFLRSPLEFNKIFLEGGYLPIGMSFYDATKANPFVEINIASFQQPLIKRTYKSMILTYKINPKSTPAK